MKLGPSAVKYRRDRKWSFKYAAAVLEKVYKPTGGTRDEHIRNLINELNRRSKIVPSLKNENTSRDVQKEAVVSKEKDG